MDPTREKELDYLLAGGRLARPALERVFRTVVAAESRGRSSRHEAWKLLWLAPLAAATVLLLVRPAGIRSKGAAEEEAAAPRFELVCADVVGSAVHCARSEVLYFWFPGATEHVFLSAYAEPVAGGERVWFFPTASTPQVELTKGPGPKAAPNAVMLADVSPGYYTVHVWLSHEPLDRSDVERGQRLAAASLTVLP